MTDYREIYNDVVEKDHRYNLAENSPGYRAVVQETARLSAISGRSLDIGCGVGFVVDYLCGPTFQLHPFGIDVSDLAIEKAKKRLGQKLPNSNKRLATGSCMELQFEDNFFSLVTCFDVLEHLDIPDIDKAIAEIGRVLRNGGIFFGSVSCRPSGVKDLHGDNLHRTVENVDWWIERFEPDTAIYDGKRKQLALWKRKSEAPVKPAAATKEVAGHPADSKALYQKIYDDNPWYGNAVEGRCPGVRLMPQYMDWLTGRVIDLGCGRGQTVEKLREMGFEAEGIDQIKKHPGMRVGDITQPIDDISKFDSAVCVDCIEHLYDHQVEGLFANMKQVKRQAFSIHNGESTGTGQELHVNRRSFDQWRSMIKSHFSISEEIELHDNQMLYLTSSN